MNQKKYILKALFLACITSLLSSCQQVKDQLGNVLDASSKDTVFRVNGYQVTAPTYLKRVTTLNEDASLQLQNILKDSYLIVIDESKDTLLSAFEEVGAYNKDSSVVKNYRDVQLELIKGNLKVINQSSSKASKINGHAAETVEIDGEIADVPQTISYIYTFIEGPDKVYMFMAVTLKENKEKHRPMFMKIINSFQTVKNQ